jgi:ABC-type phosphate transport system substrate-binding protein
MHRRVKNIPLLLLLLTGFGASPAKGQSGAIAVVVADKNPTINLRASELRQIFAGEKRTWSNGIAIKIFVRGSGTLERKALLGVLGMTELEYGQYWKSQIFRGEAQSEPIALPSNGMQREAVLAYPGAVGLVSVEDVRSGMKVIKVNGRVPGEPGYSLR